MTPFRVAVNGEIPKYELGHFNFPKRIFKELYFDPVSRLRRGEVYVQIDQNPFAWTAQDHYRTDLGNAYIPLGSKYRLDLITYHNDHLEDIRPHIGTSRCPRVILGDDRAQTFWKVINLEASYTEARLLTLKAEDYFGEMPVIVKDKIPEQIRATVLRNLDELAANMSRTTPSSVVDRCRDILSLIFSDATSAYDEELVKATARWEKNFGDNASVRSHCSYIVARLHARKPKDQLNEGRRPISESDALLAVRCVWTTLVEFGWAYG